ncbi:MAG: TraB/GumN family protein [Saprospiraceae bacterium]|nr:TraB/GumN family protein [Saprospiraceae bacterium]
MNPLQLRWTLLLLLLGWGAFAQTPDEKKDYELLWEVTGPQLSEPSYLFGTMHLRDKRVFEFPDSLPIYFEQCKAFAMEIHTDSLIQFTFDLMTMGDTSNVLREMLDPVAYAKVDEAVRAKTGSPIDSLDVKNPMFIEMLLNEIEEPEGTDKNFIFLDLYLHKLAMESGKQIFGLEKIKDYRNVTRSFFNQFSSEEPSKGEIAKQFEEWISIYRKGDLKEIMKAMNNSGIDSEYAYELLNGRNYKMADSFEKLAQQQSTFCAVGAAHLPGEEGLVQLLRKRGYQVRRVTPVFTGKAANYEYKKAPLEWYTYQNENLGSRFEVPSKFIPLKIEKMLGDNAFKLAFDFTTMQAFAYVSFPIPEGTSSGTEEQLKKALIESDFGGENASKGIQTSIERSGFKGIHVLDTSANNSVFEVFLRQGKIHMFMNYNESDSAGIEKTNRFFESIQFDPVPETNQTLFRNKAGAFELAFPVQPNYKRYVSTVEYEEGATSTYYLHLYFAQDPETQINYFIRYNNFPNNRTVLNEDKVIEEVLNQLINRWGAPITEIEKTPFRNCSALSTTFVVEGKEVMIKIFIRDSRIYLLMAQSPMDAALAEGWANFTESFSFLPYQFSEIKKLKIEESSFEIAFPQTPDKIVPEITSNDYPQIAETKYLSQDTLSGIIYGVTKYNYTPYYEVPDTSALFEAISSDIKADQTVKYFTDTIFQGRHAWFSASQEEKTTTWNYDLLFFNGIELWELFVYVPNSSMKDKALSYFDSFRPFEYRSSDELIAPKAEQLLADLQSGDSLTYKMARVAIDKYEFAKSDLPYIYAAIEAYPVKDSLAEVLSLFYREFEYVHDEKSIPFLKKEYQRQKSPQVKARILESMADMKTKESVSAFIERAVDFRKEEFDGFVYEDMFETFYDSTAFVRQHLPEFMKLINNRALRYNYYNLLFNSVPSDSLLTQMLEKHTDVFLQDANRMLQTYPFLEPIDTIKEVEEYWHFDALNILLGNMNTQAAIQDYFKELQGIQDPMLLATVIDALLKNGQAVDPTIWDTVKAKPYYWFQLLQNLASAGTDYAIPTDLLDQPSIVKALIDYDLDNYFGDYEQIKILEKRAFEYGGETYTNYLLRIPIEEPEAVYLAIVSQPADLNESTISPVIAQYSSEYLTEDNLEELYQQTLEEWKANQE